MLSRQDIVRGLRELGLVSGDRVMVHSSMAAFGPVDGGADTVIDALLEAVGPDGLVVVPTFGCKPPFDRRSSATPLGAVPDRFWRRAEAVRSLHPTHSVAAIGKGAEDLIRDHEKAPTAYSEGTPYHTLAMQGGKVLLLGVDQDRNTTLHTAEALAEAPYLDDVEGAYTNDKGNAVTIGVRAMAGPHRDFIGLDRLFRERGIMSVGRIGGAVCRLMDGRQMVETALEAIRRDPAAVLCGNPACGDCVMQRGRIKAARLSAESFTLAAVFGDIDEGDPAKAARALKGQGIFRVEMTAAEHSRVGARLAEEGVSCAAVRARPDDGEATRLAASLGVPLIAPVGGIEDFERAMELAQTTAARVLITNAGAGAGFYRNLYNKYEGAPDLAFSPAGFASAGEKPFLEVFYRGTLRKHASHFYIDDFRGSDASPVVPGEGNAEVKEIISMLRCRSYGGVMTLRSPGGGVSGFRAAAEAFWGLMDSM